VFCLRDLRQENDGIESERREDIGASEFRQDIGAKSPADALEFQRETAGTQQGALINQLITYH